MEGIKEGLIGICLFMIGGRFVLFLQSGKRYQKSTKIVLELSGISLFIALVLSGTGERSMEAYWNRLEQTGEIMQGDAFYGKSMDSSEIEQESTAFQELFMDSIESKTAEEIKSKINNSEIGEKYTVYQAFWEEKILYVTLSLKEDCENRNEIKRIVPVENVSIDVNGTCQNQNSISDIQESQLKEEIAAVLEMDQCNLEVVLQ